MDNLTHTLVGMAIARTGLAQRVGARTTLALAIAANIPDIDFLWTIWDPTARFLWKRAHTHSILLLPVLAALLAIALRPWMRHIRWRTLFGLSALGIASHILLDLLNSFGVVLLCPLDWRRFEVGAILIVDLAIWSILLVPIVAGFFRISETMRRRLNQISLALVVVYAGLCIGARERAEVLARHELARAGVRADSVRVFPELPAPFRFRVTARIQDEYTVYLCRVFSGTCEPIRTVRTEDHDPRVAAIRATRRGRDLDWFMAAPVWTAREDGSVEVYDLRFTSSFLPRRMAPFTVRFPPGRTEAAR